MKTQNTLTQLELARQGVVTDKMKQAAKAENIDFLVLHNPTRLILDEKGKIITCVRHKDIVHYLVEHFAQQVLNLPPDPDKMPDTPEGG